MKVWAEKEHESVTAARHIIDLADDYQERIEQNLALIGFFKNYNEYGSQKFKRGKVVKTIFKLRYYEDADLLVVSQELIDEMVKQAEKRIEEYRHKLLELKA